MLWRKRATPNTKLHHEVFSPQQHFPFKKSSATKSGFAFTISGSPNTLEALGLEWGRKDGSQGGGYSRTHVNGFPHSQEHLKAALYTYKFVKDILSLFLIFWKYEFSNIK